MPTLVSPGVSVSVTDESFFIPAAASTVPLFFFATASHKLQPDGEDALGTQEYNTVRTVTSLDQSVRNWGVPVFYEDSQGNAHHGEARNEYGLFAMNQYLGVGNFAYAVRANINLNDDRTSVLALWQQYLAQATVPVGAAYLTESKINDYIATQNVANGAIVGAKAFTTVDVGGSKTGASATGLANDATVYEATVTVHGVANVISVVGSAAQTYTDLLTELNTDLTGATASLDTDGNLVITTDATTTSQLVLIADDTVGSPVATPVFGSLTDYVQIKSPVGPFKSTVTLAEYVVLATEALDEILGIKVVGLDTLWEEGTFSTLRNLFIDDQTSAPFPVYADGYDMAATDSYLGVTGNAEDWVANTLGTVIATEWTAAEARDEIIAAADDFQYTVEFLNGTSLGSTDAERRVAIAESLVEVINSNQDIRAESFEYNLILAPGYHEPTVVSAMQALSFDIKEEAMVIADTPLDNNPEDVVNWADNTGGSNRIRGTNIAYYYPGGLASNLDGATVLCAASGIALRTITLSDKASEIWFAPAGVRRGLVSGVSAVGHASGTLGGPTTFVDIRLNEGQRDTLYKYETNVNPIVNFPTRGILIWGQKTSAVAASARDRINVERMIMHTRRALRKGTISYVFEPNDQLTRDDLKATVDGFLGDIMLRRGLYDYSTVCDESNNTAERIDRNEMYIDVAIKPAKAAEFLFIPIRVVNTGTAI